MPGRLAGKGFGHDETVKALLGFLALALMLAFAVYLIGHSMFDWF